MFCQRISQLYRKYDPNNYYHYSVAGGTEIWLWMPSLEILKGANYLNYKDLDTNSFNMIDFMGT